MANDGEGVLSTGVQLIISLQFQSYEQEQQEMRERRIATVIPVTVKFGSGRGDSDVHARCSSEIVSWENRSPERPKY